MNFFWKKMFRSQDIFLFLWNPPKSKSFSILNIYTLNIKNTVTSHISFLFKMFLPVFLIICSLCCMTNISNMFLTQCWKLETRSRTFYFIKMAILWDLVIFNSWHVPFSNLPHSSLQKMRRCNLDIIGYWLIGAGCSIEENLELSPGSPNCSKDSWKLLPLFISINWPNLVT